MIEPDQSCTTWKEDENEYSHISQVAVVIMSPVWGKGFWVLVLTLLTDRDRWCVINS